MKSFWEAVKKKIWESTLTDWIISALTLALAIVAYQQFVITRRQLQVQQVDERAWVEAHITDAPPNSPSLESGDIKANTPIAIPIELKNTGKTPARQVEIVAFVVTEEAKEPVPLQCAYSKATCSGFDEKYGVLLPNAPERMVVFRWDDQTKPVVATAQEESDYLNNKLYVAVFGTVSYHDVFGSSHFTRFCIWHNRFPQQRVGFNVSSCGAFNDAIDSSDQTASETPR